jgi:hypothetical protein
MVFPNSDVLPNAVQAGPSVQSVVVDVSISPTAPAKL